MSIGVFGRLLVAIATIATLLARPVTGHEPSTVAAALAYANGQYQSALAGLPASTTVGGFLQDLNGWIRAAPASDRQARALQASVFAMDTAWSLSRSHDRHATLSNSVWIDTSGARSAERRDWSKTRLTDSQSQFPIAAWACELAPSLRLSGEVERVWWRLTVALMENIRVWRALLGPDPSEEVVEAESLVMHELRDGHVRHVPGRLMSTPEFVLARTLGTIARDVAFLEPSRSGRSDVLRAQPLTVRAAAALPAARKELMTLAVHPTVRGEVLLRAAYFDLRLGRFDQALLTVGSARPLGEPFLEAVADYLTGWIHQHESRHDLAIEFLTRARQYVPKARNISVLLAQELFLTARAADAHSILDDLFRAPLDSIDLLTSFERGGARHIPELLEVLRRGLR